MPAVSSLPENETVGSALRLKRGSAEPSPFKELTLILSNCDGLVPLLHFWDRAMVNVLRDPAQFSWSRSVAIPVIFTALGAALGFVASQLRDELKARRDKKAFLRAVGMELDALSIQLTDSLREVKNSAERVKGKGPGSAICHDLANIRVWQPVEQAARCGRPAAHQGYQLLFRHRHRPAHD